MPITPENMKQRTLLTICVTISPQVLRSVHASGIERVALMPTDITLNIFDVRIIVLFLYLMTNNLLL